MRNQNLIVFTCGPSIRNHDIDKIVNQNSNAIFIAIKDAIELLNHKCDIHVFNSYNVKKWSYPNSKIIKIKSKDKLFNFNKFDLEYHIKQKKGNNLKYIEKQQKNEEFNWAPGIILEFIIPLSIRSKVKSLTIYGWDQSKKEGDKFNWFYKKNFKFNWVKYIFLKFFISSWIIGFLSHIIGLRYNSDTISKSNVLREFHITLDYLRAYKKILKKNKIKFKNL